MIFKSFFIIIFHFAIFSGYPPTFQAGLASTLPTFSSQQSSLYGETSSSSFTLPTTTVSSHYSSSAFHKPDESTNSSYSLHQQPSIYNSSTSFSTPISTAQQQVIECECILKTIEEISLL